MENLTSLKTEKLTGNMPVRWNPLLMFAGVSAAV